MDYLEAEHPGLYEQLILNGTLDRHLADVNERAISMLERLIDQMATQEGMSPNDYSEALSLAEWAANRLNASFIAVDLAKMKDGRWIIIEVNSMAFAA